mmetsp:Transcript_54581/g.84866  ORF Transcript_54581/g.84866 Transcript_54581/m.84866 type:complete len:144 (+) Transcript_54581:51-482(+)|eukprot:CAMPEP_0169368216 /NCGR_PEP_ID=MMETSP1017-20121227/34119_1 /TAXON_ID=342587 /ORGANISM="Karlodinium micrum, Strain CCMP2283" /LENGTH=143 /DNA_ID=CAMNT_0009466379 /DNA_START=26 /DNA_END=457 /DNA_ORIENTATION=-
MCSESEKATPAEHEDADMAQWQLAVKELQDVDGVISELREELQSFLVRREVIAKRKADLQRRLADRGEKVDCSPSKVEGASTTASESSYAEPQIFKMDEGNPLSSRPNSIEDWEGAFDMIQQAGQTRDRGAALRARLVLSSNK